jgi:hypothetical protein
MAFVIVQCTVPVEILVTLVCNSVLQLLSERVYTRYEYACCALNATFALVRVGNYA